MLGTAPFQLSDVRYTQNPSFHKWRHAVFAFMLDGWQAIALI